MAAQGGFPLPPAHRVVAEVVRDVGDMPSVPEPGGPVDGEVPDVRPEAAHQVGVAAQGVDAAWAPALRPSRGRSGVSDPGRTCRGQGRRGGQERVCTPRPRRSHEDRG